MTATLTTSPPAGNGLVARRVADLLLAAVVLLGGCGDDSASQTADNADDHGVVAASEAGAEEEIAGSETRLARVRFITLRNPTGSNKPGEYFGDERGVVRAGRCEVAWTPIRVLHQLAKSAPLYIPSENVETTGVVAIDTQTFWREYRDEVGGAEPVLYVHGYNIGFDKGCQRAARITANLGLGERLLLFSWPSDGAALNYTRDEADLSWSVKHLKETFARMETLFGRGAFDVVGHSLGARGVVLALATMSDLGGSTTPLVDRLVLVAADIDADIFRQLLPALRRRAAHITLYVSARDSALALSREVHGYPRLGEAGKHLVALDGVEIVDVSELPLRRVTGHLYHLYNDIVFSDLAELLNERLGAAQRTLPRLVDRTVPYYWRIPAPSS